MKFLKSKANKQHVVHPNVRKKINKFFWHVKVGEVDKSKSFDCETIYGSCSMH